MRKCPVCEFINRDERDTCLRCSAQLAQIELPPRKSLPPALERAGQTLAWAQYRFARACLRTQQALAVPLPEGVSHRFPFVAAFLSVVPGLGQLYNYQPRKTLYFLLALGALFAATVRYITQPYAGTALIAALIALCCLSYADALVTAARINGQVFSTRYVLAALTYPFFLVGLIGIICTLMAWMQWPVFTHYAIHADYMMPALQPGDRVWNEGLTYLVRRPRPGDVVRYDPPRYEAWQGNDVYSVNPGNGWERVMAVGGETLEYRDGEFYVDGKRLARAYHPLMTRNLPSEITLTCPPGKYIVLITWRAEDHSLINLLGGTTGPAPLLSGANWLGACVVGREEIRDRAWFIAWPGPRRRFFQARGPRFEPYEKGQPRMDTDEHQ